MPTTNTNTIANIEGGGIAVREIDFVSQFSKTWEALYEILGIMRPIRKAPGTELQSIKATVDLADSVAEGVDIDFSKVNYRVTKTGKLTVGKYATSTTIEAVERYGAAIAIEKSDEAFRDQLVSMVLSDFYDFLLSGTLVSTETTFQMAVAMAIGRVSNKWKQMHKGVGEIAVFVNTLDAYRYLGSANISIQSQNGIQYVRDFMGARIIILSSEIPEGKVCATPVGNIDLYYADPEDSDFKKLGLEFRVDGETNLIGFHTVGNYKNATGESYAIMGMKLWAEYHDGIAVIDIDANPLTDATVSAATKETYWGHNLTDLQTGVTVTGDKITGTLKKVTSGALANDWGEGYFLALKWSVDATATSLKVGITPSEGAGMQEGIDDPDRDGVFKVTDKYRQRFVIITAKDGHSKTQTFDLSGLTLE